MVTMLLNYKKAFDNFSLIITTLLVTILLKGKNFVLPFMTFWSLKLIGFV